MQLLGGQRVSPLLTRGRLAPRTLLLDPFRLKNWGHLLQGTCPGHLLHAGGEGGVDVDREGGGFRAGRSRLVNLQHTAVSYVPEKYKNLQFKFQCDQTYYTEIILKI